MALEKIRDLLQSIAQAARVETVFGEPREVAGKTIIPVARVMYGGGGGGGQGQCGENGTGTGGGGGIGVGVHPVGFFVVTEEGERWVPTVDATRVIIAGSAVLVATILTIRKIAMARAKAAKWRARERE